MGMIRAGDQMWCHRHWEPCPKEDLNGIVATMKLLWRLLADKKFREACGAKEDSPAKIEIINLKIPEFSPICCYLGDTIIDEIWKEIRIIKYAPFQ